MFGLNRASTPGVKFPCCIPGSDGAGVVVAAGSGAGDWVGRDVIINPSFDWGPSEPQAFKRVHFPSSVLPKDGNLRQRIAILGGGDNLRPSPPRHLSWEEAAALPLAGPDAAWRALDARARIHSTDRVLVTGIGGGVALFALQYAVAHGAEVWVTSSSEEKIARAVQLGAQGGFVYTRPGWAAAAKSGGASFDLIVDSAGGEGFGDLLDLAASGGRIVFYGATRGNPSGLALRKIFWRQLSLLGTTMGSPADWAAMVAYVAFAQDQAGRERGASPGPRKWRRRSPRMERGGLGLVKSSYRGSTRSGRFANIGLGAPLSKLASTILSPDETTLSSRSRSVAVPDGDVRRLRPAWPRRLI